ncbi:hypothetical protein [Xanthomonas vesicatoria]|uniref:hypothetical protein n=1 Tax=Xanthomonas vesicatoria TaxID=56460 RepID=UPI001E29FDFF|nr:hypothetical protein [Xanthomonas vesicatoria]
MSQKSRLRLRNTAHACAQIHVRCINSDAPASTAATRHPALQHFAAQPCWCQHAGALVCIETAGTAIEITLSFHYPQQKQRISHKNG